MDSTSTAIVVSTLLGPVLAVQAQKWIERLRRKQESKERIFKILMATRATRLNVEHVQALNGIEMAFYGNRGADKMVISEWRAYLDNLNEPWPAEEQNAFMSRRDALFVKLLHTMAGALGYTEFDETHMKKMAYSPRDHSNIEEEQRGLRKAALNVFGGNASLKVQLIERLPTGPSELPPPPGASSGTGVRRS